MARLIETIKSFFFRESASLQDPDFYLPNNVSAGNQRYYRRLTTDDTRDLNEFDHSRMLALSQYTWRRNGVARHIVNLLTAFAIGDGVAFHAESPDIQQVLDDFWGDAKNNWPVEQIRLVRQLSIDGELCLTWHIDPTDGFCRYGVLNPQRIDRVEVDPRDVRTRLRVHLKVPPGSPPEILNIVQPDLDPQSSTFGLLTAPSPACSYFAINTLSGNSRGYSDLLPILDSLDVLDRWRFQVGTRAISHSGVQWDVTLTGADEKRLADWWIRHRDDFDEVGQVHVHSDNTTIAPLVPAYHGPDAESMDRVLQQPILSAYGFPAHWFVEGQSTNLATAQAQQMPVLKTLTQRQMEVRAIFLEILSVVRDAAIAANPALQRLTPAERQITVVLPEVDTADLSKAAAALKDVTAAAVVMEDRAYIDHREASNLTRRLASETGTELPPLAEGEEIQPAADGGAPQPQLGAQQDAGLINAMDALRRRSA